MQYLEALEMPMACFIHGNVNIVELCMNSFFAENFLFHCKERNQLVYFALCKTSMKCLHDCFIKPIFM